MLYSLLYKDSKGFLLKIHWKCVEASVVSVFMHSHSAVEFQYIPHWTVVEQRKYEFGEGEIISSTFWEVSRYGQNCTCLFLVKELCFTHWSVFATQTFPLRRLVLQTGISGKYKLPSVFSFFIYLFIVSVFLLLSSLYFFLLSIKMFSDSDQRKILWHFSLFFHYLFYYCYVFFFKIHL